jgi:hypothetical protein
MFISKIQRVTLNTLEISRKESSERVPKVEEIAIWKTQDVEFLEFLSPPLKKNSGLLHVL